MFEAILNAGIRSRFSSIPGYGTTFTAPTGVSGYAELHALTDATTRVARADGVCRFDEGE